MTFDIFSERQASLGIKNGISSIPKNDAAQSHAKADAMDDSTTPARTMTGIRIL
jgi:hypothetical protein